MSRQKRCRRRLLLLLLLLLTVGNVVLLQLRIAPMLRKIAENQVVNAASEAIFRAVTRQLQTGSVDYNRIIGLEKDASGKVSALTTDMEQIARLKSEILTLLDEELAKMNEFPCRWEACCFRRFLPGAGFRFLCACLRSTARTLIFTARSSRSASTRAYSRSALPSPSAYRFSRRPEFRIRT